jgi:hypothetical protein
MNVTAELTLRFDRADPFRDGIPPEHGAWMTELTLRFDRADPFRDGIRRGPRPG